MRGSPPNLVAALPGEHPVHGTRHRPSGMVGDFWISIPVVAVVGVAAGLGAALVIDAMYLHHGPYGALSGITQLKSRVVVALVLTLWWAASTALCPVVGGWIAGFVARKARTRSSLALGLLALDGAFFAALGALLGFSAMTLASAASGGGVPTIAGIFGALPAAASQVASNASAAATACTGWDLGALAMAGIGCAAGVLYGRGFGRRAMYDEAGGGWHGRPVPLGRRYFDESPHAPLDPDRIAALEALPEDRVIPIGVSWIELSLHPSASEAPSTELVSAERRWEAMDDQATRKNEKRARNSWEKRNRSLRKRGLPEERDFKFEPVVLSRRKPAMPPTYIDGEVVRQLRAE